MHSTREIISSIPQNSETTEFQMQDFLPRTKLQQTNQSMVWKSHFQICLKNSFNLPSMENYIYSE